MRLALEDGTEAVLDIKLVSAFACATMKTCSEPLPVVRRAARQTL